MDSQMLENEAEKPKRQSEAPKSVKKPTTLIKGRESQKKNSSTTVNLDRRASKQSSNLQLFKSNEEVTNKSSVKSLKIKTSTSTLKDKSTIGNNNDKKVKAAPSKSLTHSSHQDLTGIKKSSTLPTTLTKVSRPKVATSSNYINKQKATDQKLETSMKPLPSNINSQKKVTNTLMISKKSKLLDEKSPRIKVSNSNEKYNLNNNNNRRNVPTNVTVNSPKHKRKLLSSASLPEDNANPSFNVFMTRTNEISIENLNQGKAPSVDEEKDDKFKHKRFRTRTLEPEEIKIIKKGEESSSNDIEMKKLVQNFVMNDQHVPLIGKPKAFYINLDEPETSSVRSSTKLATKVVKNPSPAHSENDSVNYEDDFESYESDFESFDSSSHNEQSSESNSVSSKNSESFSLSHNTSNDNNSLSLKQTPIHNEEINLDSGNYDYREIKSGNSYQLKMGDIEETAMEIKDFPYSYENTKVNDSIKQMSYTDEGFDENSGGFSSTSNSGFSKPEDVVSVIQLKSRPKSKKMTLLEYYQQRARDLCSLITLDEIKYSLFEINPVPYDVFIKTFGKSNFFQGSSQTNDDYVDEVTQTDSIFAINKWTQNPINYSKYDIITSIIPEKQSVSKKNNSDLKIHNVINDLPTRESSAIEIKHLENPLEIFNKQRLGSNVQSIGLSKDSAQNVLKDHKIFSKYYLFVQNAGKMMSDYLEAESSDISKRDIFKSELKISKSFISPLKYLNKINYLEKRPAQMASFSDDTCNCFITVHSRMSDSETITSTGTSVDDFISSRTLICIWCFKSNVPAEPKKVLTCIGDVNCCKVFGGISGIVVAGLSDGTISAWDLKEDDAWHKLDRMSTDGLKTPSNTNNSISNPKEISGKEIMKDESPVLRSSSFNSCHIDVKPNHENWAGPVEDILFIKAKKHHDFSDNQQLVDNSTISYDQLCSLQKYGLLTIWTIINQITSSSDPMEEMNLKNFVNNHSSPYWSKLTLHKSLVINMSQSADIENGTNTSSMNAISPEAKDVLYPAFPLTDVHRRNSLKKTFSLKDLEAIKKSHLTAQKKRNAIVGKINTIISDPSLRNRIFGDVEMDPDTYIEEANKELQLNLNEKLTDKSVGLINWQIGLICSVVRYIHDFNNEGHLLVACNAGKVAHYLQRGYVRDPSIFYCSDNASTVNAIEVCPHGLLYFLVSCDDHSIYLCSLTNERPLKTFFNQHGITELVLQQNDIEKFQREEIICVQWSRIRPCLFIALSRKGRLTVWDLMKSDLVPILIEKLNASSDTRGDRVKEIKLATVADGKNGHKKELLILIFISGKIEIHTLHEELYLSNINSSQERLILAKYFELL